MLYAVEPGTKQMHFAVERYKKWQAHSQTETKHNLPNRTKYLQCGVETVLRHGVDAGSIDMIFATDCAYHFHTRERFFQTAFQLLRPRHDSRLTVGARLTLADIVSKYAVPSRWSLRGVALQIACKMCRVPYDNIYTLPTYVGHLKRAGFDDIRTRRVGQHVFSGFSAFVRAQYKQLGPRTSWVKWLKFRITARFCDYFWHNELLDFVLVSARRP